MFYKLEMVDVNRNQTTSAVQIIRKYWLWGFPLLLKRLRAAKMNLLLLRLRSSGSYAFFRVTGFRLLLEHRYRKRKVTQVAFVVLLLLLLLLLLLCLFIVFAKHQL